ncbi:MAG: oligosaccharide flippase family protein [Prolixibacteraceae bacterium]
MKIIKEDNFLSLAGNLVISFFGIASFSLLARTFPMEVFGEWVIFISASTLIEMFRYGIINTAIVRYLSGAKPEDRIKFIGSNGLIGIIASIIIFIVLYLTLLAFPRSIHNSGYELFFKWYPLMALINLPMNTALVILQSDLKFGKILLIRSIESAGFFLFVSFNFLFLHLSLTQLVWSYLMVDAIASGTCIIMGWDGLKYLTKATLESVKTLLHFGKYTAFTLIGTNLLRSADTFIISFSPMGTAAVALYSIPMKITELQQIPLRSFAATAFPKLSKASMNGKYEELKEIFYTYSGAMTYLFMAISLVIFVFADLFVLVLGGKQYLGADPVSGFNAATILRIFCIYGIFLPIDRMTGITLDSMNKPSYNFLKVLWMIIANVIGDLIAIFYFKSLNLVAVASIFFTIIGIGFGFLFMRKVISLKIISIFSYGLNFYKMIFERLSKKSF